MFSENMAILGLQAWMNALSRAGKEEEAEFFQIADGDMRSWEEHDEIRLSWYVRLSFGSVRSHGKGCRIAAGHAHKIFSGVGCRLAVCLGLSILRWSCLATGKREDWISLGHDKGGLTNSWILLQVTDVPVDEG